MKLMDKILRIFRKPMSVEDYLKLHKVVIKPTLTKHIRDLNVNIPKICETIEKYRKLSRYLRKGDIVEKDPKIIWDCAYKAPFWSLFALYEVATKWLLEHEEECYFKMASEWFKYLELEVKHE